MSKSFFTAKVAVRFHHADPAGIVFFARVFELAHDAFEDFVEQALGMDWKDWFQNQEWAAPIRHSSAEYFAPIKPGICNITVKIEKIGESSFTAKYVFESAGVKNCEVSLVHAFMNLSTKAKQTIPSNIRSRLESYLV